jgi:hypothetical protein
VLALTTLVEFAENTRTVELAAGLLDKTLFTLAANSWRGAHVSAHGGRTCRHSGLRDVRRVDRAGTVWIAGRVGDGMSRWERVGVCCGRRAVDGSFAEFVSALGVPEFAPDGVDYRGLSLHWGLLFTVDGALVTPPPMHIDNPLCRVPLGANEMRVGDHVISLLDGRKL